MYSLLYLAASSTRERVCVCVCVCVCVRARTRMREKEKGGAMGYVIHSFHLTLWQWNYTANVLCRRLGIKFNGFNFSGTVLQQDASPRFHFKVNKIRC
jgi:hypothetical protein